MSGKEAKECIKLLKQTKKEEKLLEGCRQIEQSESPLLEQANVLNALVALFDAKQSEKVLEQVGKLLSSNLEGSEAVVSLFIAEGSAKKSSPCYSIKRFFKQATHTNKNVAFLSLRCIKALRTIPLQEEFREDLEQIVQYAITRSCDNTEDERIRKQCLEILFEIVPGNEDVLQVFKEAPLPQGIGSTTIEAVLCGATSKENPLAVQDLALQLCYRLSVSQSIVKDIVLSPACMEQVMQAFLRALERFEKPVESKKGEDVEVAKARNERAKEIVETSFLQLVWCFKQAEKLSSCSTPEQNLNEKTSPAEDNNKNEIEGKTEKEEKKREEKADEQQGSFSSEEECIKGIISLIRQEKDERIRLRAVKSFSHLALSQIEKLVRAGCLEALVNLVTAQLNEPFTQPTEYALHLALLTASRSNISLDPLLTSEQLVKMVTAQHKVGLRFVEHVLRLHPDWITPLAASGLLQALDAPISCNHEDNEVMALSFQLAGMLLTSGNFSAEERANWGSLLAAGIAKLSEAELCPEVDFISPWFRPCWIFDTDTVQQQVAGDSEEDQVATEIPPHEIDSEEKEDDDKEEIPLDLVDSSDSVLVDPGRWTWEPRPEFGELAAFQEWNSPASPSLSRALMVRATSCSRLPDLDQSDKNKEEGAVESLTLTPAASATTLALEVYPEMPWAEVVEKQDDLRAIVLQTLVSMFQAEQKLIEKEAQVSEESGTGENAAKSKPKDKNAKGGKSADTSTTHSPFLSAMLFDAKTGACAATLLSLENAIHTGSAPVQLVALRALVAACSLQGGRLAIFEQCVLPELAQRDEMEQADDQPVVTQEEGPLDDDNNEEKEEKQCSEKMDQEANMEEAEEVSEVKEKPGFLGQLTRNDPQIQRQVKVAAHISSLLGTIIHGSETEANCLLEALRACYALCKDQTMEDWNQPIVADIFCAFVLKERLLPAILALCSLGDSVGELSSELALYLILRGVSRETEWTSWETPQLDENGQQTYHETETLEDGSPKPIMVREGRGADPNEGPTISEWSTLLNMESQALDICSQKEGQSAAGVVCQLSEKFLFLLEALLKAQADLDHADVEGVTPLMRALSRGLDTFASLLVSTKKVNLDAVDKLGRNVLLYAFLSPDSHDVRRLEKKNDDILLLQGSPRLVCLLVEHGADVNVSEASQGTYPLHWLCSSVSLKTMFGKTPVVVEKGTLSHDTILDILDVLLLAGADVDHCNLAGQTPLHVALQHNDFEIASILLRKGAFPNIVDQNGNLPLHFACQGNHFQATSMVKALLVAGNNKKVIKGQFRDEGRGKSRASRLEFRIHRVLAQEWDNITNPGAICDKTSSREELFTWKNKQNWAPVHIAAAGQLQPVVLSKEQVSWLFSQALQHGGSELDASQFFTDAELIASWPERKQLLEMAVKELDFSKVVNVLGEGNRSILSVLLQRPVQAEPGIVELLCSQGANVQLPDDTGLCAIHYAIMSGTPEAAITLLRYSQAYWARAAFSPALLLAARASNEIFESSEGMRVLLKSLVTKDNANDASSSSSSSSAVESNSDGTEVFEYPELLHGTPLTIACAVGNSAVTEFLIRECDVDRDSVAARSGHSALHTAAFFGKTDCISVLQEYSASFDMVNSSGEGPVFSAIRGNQPAALAELLGTVDAPGPCFGQLLGKNKKRELPLFVAEELNMQYTTKACPASDAVVNLLLRLTCQVVSQEENDEENVEENTEENGEPHEDDSEESKDDLNQEEGEFEREEHVNEDEDRVSQLKTESPSTKIIQDEEEAEDAGEMEEVEEIDWSPLKFMGRDEFEDFNLPDFVHAHPCFSKGIMFSEWRNAREQQRLAEEAEMKSAATRIQAIHRGRQARTQMRLQTKKTNSNASKMDLKGKGSSSRKKAAKKTKKKK